MLFGVLGGTLGGVKNFHGLFEMFQIGVSGSVLDSLQGITTRGLGAMVFPNGMFANSWADLASDKIVPNAFMKVFPLKMEEHTPPVIGQGKAFFGTTVPGRGQ